MIHLDFIIWGLENQDNVHYAMPLRHMLNDSLTYIFNELKCVTLDIFGKDSHVFNRVCYLEEVIKESFYNCGFNINKLKSFYQKYISNMDPAFIDNVKNKCVGYAFSSTGPIETALSINEILHFIHSYIVNNEKILQSLPLLNEKNNKSDYNVPTNEETRFAAIAAKYGVMILAGLARKENGKLYNSTVFWGRDGKVLDIYHKIHLAGDESEVFIPGDRLHIVDTEFGRIGMAGICNFQRQQEISQRWALI